MTNTKTLLENLPTANFTDGVGSLVFSVRYDISELGSFMEVLYPFMAEDVSIDVVLESAASLGAEFGSLRVRIWDDEFRAREVALALNAVLTKINEAG